MGVFLSFEVGERGPHFDNYPDAPVEVTGMIFVLGRREDIPCPCNLCTEHSKGQPEGPDCLIGRYHIQGIFTSEELALANVKDRTWFIGPLPLNVALPEKTVTWAGLYWPMAEQQAAEQEETSGDAGPTDSHTGAIPAT